MNRGTPSYAVEKGECGDTMFLSVLRSPAVPTYLHEPMNYTMIKWDGMRDAGDHSFTYALVGYEGKLADSTVVPDAQNYNSGLYAFDGKMKQVDVPSIKCDHAMITSLKVGENESCVVSWLILLLRLMADTATTLKPPFQLLKLRKLLEKDRSPENLKALQISSKMI